MEPFFLIRRKLNYCKALGEEAKRVVPTPSLVLAHPAPGQLKRSIRPSKRLKKRRRKQRKMLNVKRKRPSKNKKIGKNGFLEFQFYDNVSEMPL